MLIGRWLSKLQGTAAPREGAAPELVLVANVLLSAALLSGSGLLALGTPDLRRAGIFVICMILAIGVHEFAHAFTAHKLGDPTPESQGRLTLNPIAHMDPIGTLALPLIMALMAPQFLFGWGRPVETVSRYYNRRFSMRTGLFLVAIAGPVSNLLLAALTLGLVAALVAGGVLAPESILGRTLEHPLQVFFFLNLILFAFNLLPLHPLDGGKVLAWILGPRYDHIDEWLVRNGGLVVIALVLAPHLTGGRLDPLGWLFRPFMELGAWLLVSVLV